VAEQLSDAKGAVHDAVAWHDACASIVISDGQFENTGGVLSLTVTWNEQFEVLPYLSTAVYVTVVGPMGKRSVGWWVDVKLCKVQLSVATGMVQPPAT
jgi:hypothetical protein